MAGMYLGVFLIALDILMVELTLIRVFGILWYPNMAYLIITLAMFSFGLAGVYSALRPTAEDVEIENRIALMSVLLGIFILLLFPVLNHFPFDYKDIGTDTSGALGNFLIIYLFIAIPFFIGGLILSSIFSRYSARIQRLYFWDLIGAALGCVILIPLLPEVGAAGLLFVACGLALFASALFTSKVMWKTLAIIIGFGVIAYPVTQNQYIEFTPHIDKRGLKTFKT